jgi:prolyl-tRNA editing enzyme YbaK/EbsC (Cys-tRNA(Pro) deacylase)
MEIGGSLLLVGCGKMGGALLGGWLERGVAPGSVTVVEPQADLAAGFAERGVTAVTGTEALAPDAAPAVVVFAVKPQQMGAVLPGYARFARPGTVFLSIAAGKNIGYFEGHLGTGAAIVRAMPNTPAAVGRGMSVLCANARVNAAQRQTCGDLLAAVGETAWVDDEALLDPVTAVSGGGPAYVFLLGRGRRRGRATGGSGHAPGASHRGRRRRAGAPRRGAGRHPARERDQPGRHDAGGAQGADGARRPAGAHDARHRGGDAAQPRTGLVTGQPLKESAKRVQAALAARGFAFEVREFPAGTRTSAEAAAAIGCAVGQIAKSLVFRARESGRPVLVIASGANRVDEKAVGALLGEKIGRAEPNFVRAATGFAIGGVPPVGHREAPVTLIDRDLLAFQEIWAAAGTPNAVFRLKPEDLVAMTGGRIADVKQT